MQKSEMDGKKIKTGKLYITFPSDYKHLDHLDLGTE